MFGYVAPTDQRWFGFLRGSPRDEVNFWTPSGRAFRALQSGEPFFFKLKAPENAIGGFGLFNRGVNLPIWLAWDSFGESNGALSETELLNRIRANHSDPRAVSSTSPIGCRLLSEPIFFSRDMYVPVPADWSGAIMSGKRYDLSVGEGERIWRECIARAQVMSVKPSWLEAAAESARFGKPYALRPRLGQGGFRLAVYDAYDNACCVTGEHSLPVLEAAHIKPYALGGEHRVTNGLPLRRDLHRLFDLGYVTITTDLVFRVSDRLRIEYQNGHSYYGLHGRRMREPDHPSLGPSRDLLGWHNDVVFK